MVVQAVVGTLAACIGCQSGVEFIQRQVPNSLNLVTLASFLFVSLEGLVFYSKFFSVKQHIPTRAYLRLVILHFVVQLCNNYALNFDIYFPLFIIFKSATLLSHLVLRYWLRNQLYTPPQVGSILAVTAGIVLFTPASYEPSSSSAFRHQIQESSTWLDYLPVPPFFIGICLLSIAVVLSSYLGLCQEDLMVKYGKHHREAMFYVHFLSLPAFALLGSNLGSAASAATASPALSLFGFHLWIPVIWAHILLYCLLQSTV